MSIDPALIELAGRLDPIEKRIERLETLEFETVAFPAGGGFTLICDVLLAAPSAGIELCSGPLTIPTTFRHLWLVIAAQSTSPVAGKMRMHLNGPALPPGTGDHDYYTREEHPFGVPVGAGDTQAATVNTDLISDANWHICHPAGFETLPPLATNNQCACLVQLPHYTSEDLNKEATWWGFAAFEGADGGPGGISVDHGAGGIRRHIPFVTPITSLGIAPAFGELWRAGSQFTLYGL